MGKLTFGVLFVRLYKTTGYYLSACANLWGTVCPHVQIYGILFVRVCKSTGYYLSACAKMTGYYLSGVLFVRNPRSNSTLSICTCGHIVFRFCILLKLVAAAISMQYFLLIVCCQRPTFINLRIYSQWCKNGKLEINKSIKITIKKLC